MVKKQSGTTICPDQESHKTVPTGAVWGGLAKRVYTAEAQHLLGTLPLPVSPSLLGFLLQVTAKETENQRGEVTSPRSHSNLVSETDLLTLRHGALRTEPAVESSPERRDVKPCVHSKPHLYHRSSNTPLTKGGANYCRTAHSKHFTYHITYITTLNLE